MHFYTLSAMPSDSAPEPCYFPCHYNQDTWKRPRHCHFNQCTWNMPLTLSLQPGATADPGPAPERAPHLPQQSAEVPGHLGTEHIHRLRCFPGLLPARLRGPPLQGLNPDNHLRPGTPLRHRRLLRWVDRALAVPVPTRKVRDTSS